MAYTERRALSVAKERESVKAVQPVFLRQGDRGMSITGELTYGGAVFDASGYTVTFEAMNARGELVQGSASKPNGGLDGVVSWTVDTVLTARPGEAAVAYFRLDGGTGDNAESLTTDAVPVVVLRGADMSAAQAAAYQTEIDRMIAELEEAIKEAEGTNVSSVTQVPSDASEERPLLAKNDSLSAMSTGYASFDTSVTVNHATGRVTAGKFRGPLDGTADTAYYLVDEGTGELTDAGKSNLPIYMRNGEPHECASSLAVSVTGSAASAASAEKADVSEMAQYLVDDGGSLIDAGSASQPAYFYHGQPEACTASVGGERRPVYVLNGTPERCGDTLDASITGSAASATYAEQADSASDALRLADSLGGAALNVGSESRPVYFAHGAPALCGDELDASVIGSAGRLAESGVDGETIKVDSATGRIYAMVEDAKPDLGGDVGGADNPVYVSGDVIRESDADVGGERTPVYMDGGVIRECAAPCGAVAKVEVGFGEMRDLGWIWSEYIDNETLYSFSFTTTFYLSPIEGGGWLCSFARLEAGGYSEAELDYTGIFSLGGFSNALALADGRSARPSWLEVVQCDEGSTGISRYFSFAMELRGEFEEAS